MVSINFDTYNDVEEFCCLCLKSITNISDLNNPAPLDDLEEGGYCCSKCNTEKVIPERLRVANQ